MENALRGKLLTPEEVAEMLNISVKTVYTMTNKEIPVHKIRGSLRFDSADVNDYIFLSGIQRNPYQFNPKDIQDYFDRLEDQISHFKNFIAEHMEKKPHRKEAPMRV